MNKSFRTGGTLVPGSDLYVERRQDRHFRLEAVKEAAWINVFGCRTMGKSSLCAQYQDHLRDRGIIPIFVDAAGQIGEVKRPIEWVDKLAKAIESAMRIHSIQSGRQLDFESYEESQRVVDQHSSCGIALENLLLNALLGCTNQRIFLVIDEYDSIQALGFCEELLLALRRVQGAQATNPDLLRLSVCLVGLQSLVELGKPGAPTTSPVAIPIEMTDFEASDVTLEALVLGFQENQHPDKPVLRRALDFSGGQPLVTMTLLKEIQNSTCETPAEVETLAMEMVAESGQGNDLQLFQSIERALVSQGHKAFAALRAYDSLLSGSHEAHTAPDAELLRLYGLVRRKGSQLEIKGELFRRRFDHAWTERMLSRAASGLQQYRGVGKGSSKKICVINTGGTLGMVERDDKVVAPSNAAEFKSYFTSLDSIAEVEFINLFPPRDSINVFPDQWVTIARYIYDRRKAGIDGFVVAHGTDTMAYTASAVAFALGPQLRFPVVFTGAQTTPDVAYGDAHVNLYRACAVARMDIPEVTISFGNFVYRAVRAQKKDDRRFDGFESPTYPPLAEITGEINVRRELLRPLPRHKQDIELQANFETSILIVSQFPGLEPEFFEHLLQDSDQHQRCRGVIVQTLGAGNVASEAPYSFIPFVERAFRRGIPVIVTSQYPPDPGTHTKYTPAEAPILAGAIHAGNMTLAAAVTKFRWVLADVLRRENWNRRTSESKRNLVRKLMVEHSVVGEF